MNMRHNFDEIGDNSLLQEHDVIKTIIYKFPYQGYSKIMVVFEEFNTNEDFEHLSSIDILSLAEILDRFIGLGILKSHGDINERVLSIFPIMNRLNEYSKLVDKEIKRRKLPKLKNDSQEVKQRLQFDVKKGLAYFVGLDGISKTAPFRNGTSEYNIFMFLINNSHAPATTSILISELEKIRGGGVDVPDEKQRVIDKIKAIRKKLGKAVITTTTNGYLLNCMVTKV